MGSPVSDVIEVYDTEILQIEKVLEILRVRSDRQSRNRGEFDREIKERFHQIGFIVDVKWWHTNLEDVKMPEVEITGRVDDRGQGMDHERLRHEITNDVLELGAGGIINTGTADEAAMIRATENSHKAAHGGGACDPSDGHTH